jgi:hypothetical protein
VDTPDDLSIRVARLEAESAVRRLLHRYLHGIDVAATAELLELFTDDAVVELRNFPPGSGKDRDLVGRDAINAVYSLLTAGTHRHHAANTSIVVADDAMSAELSSYLLTTRDHNLSGGMYEGTAVRDAHDGRWRFSHWRVSSSWGWRVTGQDEPPYLKELLAERALRGGWPP